MAKGTNRRGRLLSWQAIQKVKQLHDEGKTYTQIIDLTGLSSATISKYLKQAINQSIESLPDTDENNYKEIQSLKCKVNELSEAFEKMQKLIIPKEKTIDKDKRIKHNEVNENKSIFDSIDADDEKVLSVQEAGDLMLRYGEPVPKSSLEKILKKYRQANSIEEKYKGKPLPVKLFIDCCEWHNSTQVSDKNKIDFSRLGLFVQ